MESQVNGDTFRLGNYQQINGKAMNDSLEHETNRSPKTCGRKKTCLAKTYKLTFG